MFSSLSELISPCFAKSDKRFVPCFLGKPFLLRTAIASIVFDSATDMLNFGPVSAPPPISLPEEAFILSALMPLLSKKTTIRFASRSSTLLITTAEFSQPVVKSAVRISELINTNRFIETLLFKL